MRLTLRNAPLILRRHKGKAARHLVPTPDPDTAPSDLVGGMEAALGALGAGIIVVDAGGRVVRMNRCAEAVTGWRRDEVVARPFGSVWTIEGQQAEAAAHLGMVLTTTQPAPMGAGARAVVLARDGRRTPVEFSVARVAQPGADGVAAVLVFWDISRLDAARLEQQRLAAIVSSSTDAIVGKTLDGRVTNWNQGAERLFGYTAEEMIGQPIRKLIPVDRQGEEDEIVRLLRAGERVPPFDTLRLRKDGGLVDVSVTISPIVDPDGRIVGASKIARDNAEQRRRQQLELEAVRLETTNRQMLEAGRLRSTFFANMSHELRTPLNAIIGFAQLLQGRPTVQQDASMTQGLQHILRSGQHLLQLINEVLDLAKLESGRFTFNPQDVSLAGLVDEVAAILEPLFADKGVALSVRVDASLTAVYLDPLRFKQVLYNYLSNAVKFSPAQGRVELRIEPAGQSHFRLDVRDEGPGITEQDQAALFADFVQLSAGRGHADGTGLGLALTRRLVEAQGGTVGVHSAPGKGAAFFAMLPRRIELAYSDVAPSPPQHE